MNLLTMMLLVWAGVALLSIAAAVVIVLADVRSLSPDAQASEFGWWGASTVVDVSHGPTPTAEQ